MKDEMKPLENRRVAGRALAARLTEYKGRTDVIVVALPRGGVPVGYEVARALDAPLDIIAARKLGAPGYPELAIGAIAGGDVRVLNDDLVEALGLSGRDIAEIVEQEEPERQRRERLYRGHRPPLDVSGRTVILVDDGIATGATLRAALAAVRRQGPRKVVVAIPVAPPEACADFGSEADACVCLLTPTPFGAVGIWYDDFTATTDEEVMRLLGSA